MSDEASVRPTFDDLLARLPKHRCSLTISHNQHRDYYQSVSEYLAEMSGLDKADRDACITSDEVWEIQWYPNTPIAFRRVVGPTLDRVLEIVGGAP